MTEAVLQCAETHEDRYNYKGSAYSSLPRLSHAQLRQYDGHCKRSIYVAIKGLVFDVSIKKDRYAKGKAYSCLAGRDVSRLLGLNILKEPTGPGLQSTCWYTGDFNEKQSQTVMKWLDFFFKRYEVVATTDAAQTGEPDSQTWKEYLFSFLPWVS